MTLTKDANISQYFFFSMWEQYVFPYLDRKYQNPINYHAGNMNPANAVWSCSLLGYIYIYIFIYKVILKALVIKIRLFPNWIVLKKKKVHTLYTSFGFGSRLWRFCHILWWATSWKNPPNVYEQQGYFPPYIKAPNFGINLCSFIKQQYFRNFGKL